MEDARAPGRGGNRVMTVSSLGSARSGLGSCKPKVRAGPKKVLSSPPRHVVRELGIRLAQGEQKRFSQAPGCGEIGPFAPPPRPPAAAQRVPRCFGAILRRHGAERGQKPAGNPEGKTRVSGDPSQLGACSGGIFLHRRRRAHVGTMTSDPSSLTKL